MLTNYQFALTIVEHEGSNGGHQRDALGTLVIYLEGSLDEVIAIDALLGPRVALQQRCLVGWNQDLHNDRIRVRPPQVDRGELARDHC